MIKARCSPSSLLFNNLAYMPYIEVFTCIIRIKKTLKTPYKSKRTISCVCEREREKERENKRIFKYSTKLDGKYTDAYSLIIY